MITFQSYSQDTIKVFLEDIAMEILTKDYLIYSNESLEDTINEKFEDGNYFLADVTRDQYVNNTIKTQFSTLFGRYEHHMKNGVFVKTKYYLSIYDYSPVIHSRQISYYKNGLRNGPEMILIYKPIYKKKKLVKYRIRISSKYMFDNDKEIKV
jgi:hypothetical protein